VKVEKPEVSVVVPARDEEQTIEELCRKVSEELERLGKSYEIIVVDDGSGDETFEAVKRARESDPGVRGVRFLRNAGKSAALAAGFERAKGDIILTMDADLQDDPAEIPKIVSALQEWHLVSGWKKNRRDPLGRRVLSRLFNLVARLFSGVRIHDMNCGFKGYRREVIESLHLYGELHRFIPALAAAKGFSIGEVPVTHHPRRHGRSRYGIERVPRGFFDLLTVLFLTQYARRPLHLFGGAGALLSVLGAAALCYLTVLWFQGDRPIGTRPLFMGGIMLLLLGAQLFSIGLVGELVTHLTHRPGEHYVVEEEL